MLWNHGASELQKFIEHLDTCVPSIKFEANISESKINFLDVKVKLNNGRITTTLYRKETDSLSYLDYSTCHPKSCKNAISYSQFLRLIRRICSDDNDFVVQSKLLALSFHNYPDHIIQAAFDRASEHDRNAFLAPKHITKPKIKEPKKVYLITVHHPSFRAVLDIVSGYSLDIVHVPLVRGFRRPQNLSDLLVRAKLTDPDAPKRAPLVKSKHRCLRTNCTYCTILDKTGRIKCPSTGRSYVTRYSINCLSNSAFNTIYVGQTKRAKRERIGEQLTSTRKNKKHLVVGCHYNGSGHNGIRDVKIFILDFVKTPPHSASSKQRRKTLELK